MKQITTTAIILRRINFGEADRILTVLTPHHGKVSLLAKGVRRAKSKLAGGLELFSVTDISFIDGRSDLKTIVSTRLATYFDKIVKSPDATLIAYDAMKYVDSYAEHSQEEIYFSLLEQVFTGLQAEVHPPAVYAWFCMQLLHASGSGMNLEKPLNAKKFTEDGHYTFSYDDMAFLADGQGTYQPAHIKLLKVLTRFSKPTQLVAVVEYESLSDNIAPLLKNVMQLNKA